jgi:hypothetical protein
MQERFSALPDRKASLPEFILICLEVLKVAEEYTVFMVNGLRELF